MKNEKLEQLKKDLDFVELDQRLEMIKIPAFSSLACAYVNQGCDADIDVNGSCPGEKLEEESN
jgi:hypothetical protein